jgi:DNA-binding MarR family transcriptional regulator
VIESHALARATDPGTSHEAAAKVDVTTTEAKVLEVIRLFPEGAIADDIAKWSGLRDGSVTPRLKPLVLKGWIEPTGETRPGLSGRRQQVYRMVTA